MVSGDAEALLRGVALSPAPPSEPPRFAPHDPGQRDLTMQAPDYWGQGVGYYQTFLKTLRISH